MSGKKTKKGVITVSFLSLLCVLSIALLFSVIWFYKIFGIVSIEGILFTINTPLDIDVDYYIKSAIYVVVLPTVGISVLIVAGLVILKKKKVKKMTVKVLRRIIGAFAGVFFLAALLTFTFCYRLIPYVVSTFQKSNFFEENYVDPNEVSITFPEQKKNIIHLYVESMESSYADEASGGTLSENIIPDLTKLAEEYTSFSDKEEGKIGGAIQNDYTGFTIASMYAQTSGLPFKDYLNQKKFSGVTKMFPGVTSIGEILEKEGYRNYFITGSDGAYAGTDTYYKQHGNYTIYDYVYFYKKKMVSECKEGYWGVEDYELYDAAKKQIVSIAASDEPFFVEVVTIDTHGPEDGFFCEKCEGKRPYKGKYRNIVACAEKQCVDFIHWVMEQPFYENTVLIVTGDHYTMSSEMKKIMKKSKTKRTIYNLIINSDTVPGKNQYHRDFTMMDMCPTILAAAGATIEGDRIGLGTNLYSGKQTLWEEYGIKYVNDELMKRSDFYMDLVTGAKK